MRTAMYQIQSPVSHPHNCRRASNTVPHEQRVQVHKLQCMDDPVLKHTLTQAALLCSDYFDAAQAI